MRPGSVRSVAVALIAGASVATPAAAAETDVAAAPLREIALAHTLNVALVVERPNGIDDVLASIQAVGGKLRTRADSRLGAVLPHAQRDALLGRLRRLGTVQSFRVTVEDLSESIATAEALLRADRESVARIERIGQRGGSVPEQLETSRELAEAQSAVARRELSLAELRARSEGLNVELTLTLPQAESFAPARLPFPWLAELGLDSLRFPTTRTEPGLRVEDYFDGELRLAGARAADADAFGGSSTFVSGAIDMRWLTNAEPFGFAGNLLVELGGGGGFLYHSRLLLGSGVPLGSRVIVSLAAGPGVGGVTGGVVPAGLLVPVELWTHLDLGWLHASAFASESWVLAAQARDQGAEHALFGDELAAGLILGVGEPNASTYSRRRSSVRFGAVYRESLGTHAIELRLGWGHGALSLR